MTSTNNGHQKRVTVEVGRAFDREPPFDATAEAALLGSIMLDPAILPDVEQVLGGSDAFRLEAHAAAFDAMLKVFARSSKLDCVLLQAELEPLGVAVDQFVQYADDTPSASSWRHYARIVHGHHVRREIAGAAAEIAFQAYASGPDADADEMLDSAEASITGVAVKVQAQGALNAAPSLETLMGMELDRLDAAAQGRDPNPGIPTGLRDLDDLLGGLRPGQLIIVGARPSIGKTALMLTIARHAALASSRAVGIFSIEMDQGSIAQRLMCAEAGVPMSSYARASMMSSAQFEAIQIATGKLADARIYVDDSAVASVARIRAAARRMVRRQGVGLVMVDYLQLLSAPGKDRENRQVEVSAISRGLKALAKELGVPVVCLAQLNRATEQRANFRPRMSDLRESGSIEQDADIVLLLHREEAHHVGDESWMDDQANEAHFGTAELIVAKQRNGPTGAVTLRWDAPTMVFSNEVARRL